MSKTIDVMLDASLDHNVAVELLNGLAKPMLKASGLDDARVVHLDSPKEGIEWYRLVFSSKEEPEVKA